MEKKHFSKSRGGGTLGRLGVELAGICGFAFVVSSGVREEREEKGKEEGEADTSQNSNNPTLKGGE